MFNGECYAESKCAHYSSLVSVRQKLQELELEYRSYVSQSEHEKRVMMLRIKELEVGSIGSRGFETLKRGKVDDFINSELIAEKNREISQLKLRFTEHAELKKDLETEAIRFRYDLEKSKSEMEVLRKEKEIECIKLRNMIDSLEGERSREVKHLNQRIEDLLLENEDVRKRLCFMNKQMAELEIQNEKMKLDNFDKTINLKQEAKVLDRKTRTKLLFHTENLLILLSNRQDKRLVKECFGNWRVKYRIRGQRMEEKYNESLQQINNNIGVIKGLRNKVLQTVIDCLFGVFALSVDSAEKKKKSSLTLFKMNFDSFASKNLAVYETLLAVHTEINDIVSRHRAEETVFINPRNFDASNYNLLEKFVIESLVEIFKQNDLREGHFKDSSEEFIVFYKFMMIYYRTIFPIKGKKCSLDQDIQFCLKYNILSQFKIILNA